MCVCVHVHVCARVCVCVCMCVSERVTVIFPVRGVRRVCVSE